MLNFDFISGDKFRELLVRDFEELLRCMDVKANKSVLILVGSIVEAMLLDYYVHNLPSKFKEQEILKFDLFKLIELAEGDSLIKSKTKELATVIRNYRNVIHPGREVRENVDIDEGTSKLAYLVLEIIHNDLQKREIIKSKLNADILFQRCKNEGVSEELFINLINRLGYKEKHKLYLNFKKQAFNLPISDKRNWYLLNRYFPIVCKYINVSIIQQDVADTVDSCLLNDEIFYNKYLLFKKHIINVEEHDKEIIIRQLLQFLEHLILYSDNEDIGYKKLYKNLDQFFTSDISIKHLKKVIGRIVDFTNIAKRVGVAVEYIYVILEGLNENLKIEIESDSIFVKKNGGLYKNQLFAEKYLEFKELPF